MAETPERDDREALAGEFVLGTLDPAERQRAVERLASDPEFARTVARWEQLLDPLNSTTAPVEPAPELFRRIERRLEASRSVMGQPAARQEGATIIGWRRQARIWRAATIAMTALAASLIGFIIAGPREAPSGRFVAAVQQGDQGPAFIVAVDTAKGLVAVRPVAARPAEAGHDYELWALGGGRQQPQSLGVIAAAVEKNLSTEALGGKERPLGDTVFAVSLEPQGGSPTGQPTGPVLWTGKLIAVE